MSVLATVFAVGSRRRVVIVAALMMVVALVAVVPGPAAAHNPACIVPGQGNADSPYDSPHYPYLWDDPKHPDYERTSSQTAYNHNPNLRNPSSSGSFHPDHANSIHNMDGTVHAPRNSGEDCHA